VTDQVPDQEQLPSPEQEQDAKLQLVRHWAELCREKAESHPELATLINNNAAALEFLAGLMDGNSDWLRAGETPVEFFGRTRGGYPNGSRSLYDVYPRTPYPLARVLFVPADAEGLKLFNTLFDQQRQVKDSKGALKNLINDRVNHPGHTREGAAWEIGREANQRAIFNRFRAEAGEYRRKLAKIREDIGKLLPLDRETTTKEEKDETTNRLRKLSEEEDTLMEKRRELAEKSGLTHDMWEAAQEMHPDRYPEYMRDDMDFADPKLDETLPGFELPEFLWKDPGDVPTPTMRHDAERADMIKSVISAERDIARLKEEIRKHYEEDLSKREKAGLREDVVGATALAYHNVLNRMTAEELEHATEYDDAPFMRLPASVDMRWVGVDLRTLGVQEPQR
jgi:hypothetical protein